MLFLFESYFDPSEPFFLEKFNVESYFWPKKRVQDLLLIETFLLSIYHELEREIESRAVTNTACTLTTKNNPQNTSTLFTSRNIGHEIWSLHLYR